MNTIDSTKLIELAKADYKMLKEKGKEGEEVLHYNGFLDGFARGLHEGSNPWHKASEELPPVDTEVVCKMKGVPRTEHFVCKWDGKYWWHWGWLNQDAQGWFGLNDGWKVVEWKEI